MKEITDKEVEEQMRGWHCMHESFTENFARHYLEMEREIRELKQGIEDIERTNIDEFGSVGDLAIDTIIKKLKEK